PEPRWELHTSAFKLSLRLLPAIIMDNDEDDDGNFTKWMSSYWGHGAGEEPAKERKRSFRRPARSTVDRRASLPCMSQLEAMKLKQLHTATMPPAPVHLKNREEKEVRSHPHARRVSSDESSWTKGGAECRISTIPELAESFERRLRFRNQKIMSLSDADSVCLICREELCAVGGLGGGGAHELHCSHRFHKEVDKFRPAVKAHLQENDQEQNKLGITVSLDLLSLIGGRKRRGGQIQGAVHAAGVPLVCANAGRRCHSVLARKSIVCPVANCPCVDNADAPPSEDCDFSEHCIAKWLWNKQSCPTCRVHVVMPKPVYWVSARVWFP
ncbi:hypothetical protein NFI96_032675, partial [Prochilodus magdalenae]